MLGAGGGAFRLQMVCGVRERGRGGCWGGTKLSFTLCYKWVTYVGNGIVRVSGLLMVGWCAARSLCVKSRSCFWVTHGWRGLSVGGNFHCRSLLEAGRYKHRKLVDLPSAVQRLDSISSCTSKTRGQIVSPLVWMKVPRCGSFRLAG